MKYFSALIILVSIAVSASAHEYWFEPDSFFLKPGQFTALHLYVGEALKKDEERVYQAAKTTSFQMFSAAGTFDMRTMADDGKSPILNFSADKPGTYLLSMERNWSDIKLDAKEFEDYLREDGMEYIVAERARLGETKKEGRERYSRFVKTLIQVGDSQTGAAKKRVGTKLEIVPVENPYSKKYGDSLKLQIFFDGFPLADNAVFAENRDGDKYSTQKLRTDRDGKFTVKLDHHGVWFIRLVYMQRCERNCGEADWESFWGSLSFGVK